MKHTVIIPLLLISIIPALSEDVKTGRIEVVGKDSVDFGKYHAREKKVATYQIRNSGTGKLEIINVRKTCGCASATCDKKILQTNETANVEVIILPNSIFGLYSKNTFIESTDPNNRFLRLTVAGHAVPLIEVSPSLELNTGRIKTNTAWTQSFSLSGTEPGVILGDLKTDSNFKVDAALERNGKAGTYRLNMTLLPCRKSGDFRCTMSIPVIIPTNHQPVAIAITGRIGTELSAIPGIAYLPLSDGPQKRQITLRLLGERSRVLKPEDIVLPTRANVSFSVSPEKHGNGLEVTATFNPEFTKELYAEENIPLEFKIKGASSAQVVCKIRK